MAFSPDGLVPAAPDELGKLVVLAVLTMLGLGVLLGSWVGLSAFPSGRHGESVSAAVGGARG